MRGKLPKDVSYATLEGHTSSVSSLAFSPDGKTLASGGNDNIIYLWSVSAGKRRKS